MSDRKILKDVLSSSNDKAWTGSIKTNSEQWDDVFEEIQDWFDTLDPDDITMDNAGDIIKDWFKDWFKDNYYPPTKKDDGEPLIDDEPIIKKKKYSTKDPLDRY